MAMDRASRSVPQQPTLIMTANEDMPTWSLIFEVANCKLWVDRDSRMPKLMLSIVFKVLVLLSGEIGDMG